MMIKVDFTCHPAPTATWSWNNVNLRGDDRIIIETTEYYTNLTIRNFSRDDIGTYKVDVKNIAGTASAKFESNVKDVPAAPRNLVVESADSESVSLSWDAPTTDGGAVITGYVI